ncbi:MAG: hypothetical protein ACFFCE_01600 [Promethearchaeota archaeon]
MKYKVSFFPEAAGVLLLAGVFDFRGSSPPKSSSNSSKLIHNTSFSVIFYFIFIFNLIKTREKDIIKPFGMILKFSIFNLRIKVF